MSSIFSVSRLVISVVTGVKIQVTWKFQNNEINKCFQKRQIKQSLKRKRKFMNKVGFICYLQNHPSIGFN